MAKSKSDEQHPAISFLRSLYALTPGGYVELRAIANDKISGPKPRRIFARTPGQVIDFAERYGGDRKTEYGVYFGICKRETEDGTKKSVQRVPSLWVDLDTVKNGWSTDEMVKRIHAIPGVLRPSACVKSGGGLHLYWYLKKYAATQTNAGDPHDVEGANKMLRDVFAGDAVQNIDRIFRLLGTWNAKRSKSTRVEVAWNYGFDLKDFGELELAAVQSKNWIGKGGEWEPRRKITSERLRTALVEPMQAFESIYGEGSRGTSKNLKTMWSDRVRYHAPRGYMGIHEASLQHTAALYMANPDTPEDKIVEVVMEQIAAVKDRDAPDEQWDMNREAEIVRGMLKSWQPKWKEYVASRRRERAEERKNNGRANVVRNPRGRLLQIAGGRRTGA